MAKILGGIMTSHVPAIGRAIARNLQGDPYFKPWFDGFAPVHQWLREVKPDVVVVVYNDHGLNFVLDRMPTFAVGAAPEYRNADDFLGNGTVDVLHCIFHAFAHIGFAAVAEFDRFVFARRGARGYRRTSQDAVFRCDFHLHSRKPP